MSVNKSTNYSMNKPTKGTRDWHNYLNDNVDIVDGELQRLKEKDTSQDLRIDNIVSQSGTDNTEIVDARLGADNVARNTLGELMREVHAEQVLANQQTVQLQHGLNVINSDQASPLKLEFYGQTLVNLLGSKGNIVKNSPITGEWLLTNPFLKAGKYYLLRTTDWINISDYQFLDGGTVIKTGASPSYFKFTVSEDKNYTFRCKVKNGGVLTETKMMTYEISSETYNKIGVSLTDTDVERMFPYVDSVQSVVNPYAKVSGANLLPPFSEWNLHANATVKSPYELELNATGTIQKSTVVINSVPNQTYTLSTSGHKEITVKSLDDKGNLNSVLVQSYENLPKSFTTDSNCFLMQIEAINSTTGTFTFTQPILNLGTTAKPFVPKNDSYIYFEGTFSGNDNKKDILSYNESLDVPRWEHEKHFVVDRPLTGDDDWAFTYNYTGYKRVQIPNFSSIKTGLQGHQLVRYDGYIMKEDNSYTKETFLSSGDGNFYVLMSDTDSGWTETMIPSADMIKAYFNGYKYTGDGTTHSWVSLVDGSAPSTNTLAYVSTTMAPNFTPYKLTYQLATPTVEPITVEGDVSIQGDAIIEIGENVVVREEVTPQFSSVEGGFYFINRKSTYWNVDNPLDYKANKIIAVYKNGSLDNKWLIALSDIKYGYSASMSQEDFDTTATYTVSYLALNDGNSAHTNDVKANFASSLKSSIYSMVSKQSDIATDVSVLDRQVYKLLVAASQNGWEV